MLPFVCDQDSFFRVCIWLAATHNHNRTEQSQTEKTCLLNKFNKIKKTHSFVLINRTLKNERVGSENQKDREKAYSA